MPICGKTSAELGADRHLCSVNSSLFPPLVFIFISFHFLAKFMSENSHLASAAGDGRFFHPLLGPGFPAPPAQGPGLAGGHSSGVMLPNLSRSGGARAQEAAWQCLAGLLGGDGGVAGSGRRGEREKRAHLAG